MDKSLYVIVKDRFVLCVLSCLLVLGNVFGMEQIGNFIDDKEIEIMHQMIDAHPVVNQHWLDKQFSSGATLLYFSTVNQGTEMVEWLLHQGVNPTKGSAMGVTPLHVAWPEEIVRMLIEHGADVNKKDFMGVTPLMTQAATPSNASLLLKAGANVNNRDMEGCTALHRACECNNVEGIKILLAAGANPYFKDKFGKYAIEYIDYPWERIAFDCFLPYGFISFDEYDSMHNIRYIFENNAQKLREVVKRKKYCPIMAKKLCSLFAFINQCDKLAQDSKNKITEKGDYLVDGPKTIFKHPSYALLERVYGVSAIDFAKMMMNVWGISSPRKWNLAEALYHFYLVFGQKVIERISKGELVLSTDYILLPYNPSKCMQLFKDHCLWHTLKRQQLPVTINMILYKKIWSDPFYNLNK